MLFRSLSTYVARERPGLNQLANSIATGQLAPGTQVGSASRVIEESQTRPRGGISSGPLDQPTRSAVSRTAPSRTAPSRVAQASSQGLGTARRPLVTIRFDRPNPAYEQPLYTAVSRALERRPSATFELVGVAANSGRQGATAMTRARAEAQRVLRTLTDMFGLPAIGRAADAQAIADIWKSAPPPKR